MHVHGESLDNEIRLTVDAAVELANTIARGGSATDIQDVLVQHDFVGAATAEETELNEAHRSLSWVAGLIAELPEATLPDAVAAVNRALASRAIAPSISDHDGCALHIHWSNTTTPLGGRVVVDILMALAQTLCDDGVERFGRCRADDCERLFYDSTKNRSRRFCSDPRCASRTHTANHRARNRRDSPLGASTPLLHRV